jgi:hypothetical protein
MQVFRSNVNRQPSPQKVQLETASLQIPLIQRGKKLLQYVIH